ncbi:hypothetical protein Pcac1_g19517 [Phytophthora cactorum]|nr:hypothetical protein Pcac1_g19517 [Phytophthora cactorum]
MTDSGKCAFVLGIELVDGPDGSVTMCQRRYVDDILKRFAMDECKAVVSHVDMSTRLVPSDAATKVNAPFREAVGALMHLMTATRPDIAYAVGYVSRFMENPQEEHWVAVKRIFRYLQGTKTHGNLLQAGQQDRLSWILGRRLGWRPRRPQVDFRLHVHADECACELGQQEAVKRVAVYERSGVYCAQSGDPRGQVDSSPAVRDPGSCQRDGTRIESYRFGIGY